MLKTFPGHSQAPGDAAQTPGSGYRIAPPLAGYPTPAAVLADGRLSRSERLRVLDAWVLEIADRDIVTTERGAGLPDGADTTLLREVNDAIAEVEATPPVPANLIGRIWQILIKG